MTKAAMFSFAPLTALALVLALPATAAAQSAPGDASCPPGSWFCAEPSQEPAAPPEKTGRPLEPLPDPDAEPEALPTPPARHRAPLPPPPPIVVYQPPPPPAEERPEAPPPYAYRPRMRSVSPPHEWGLNLHLDGVTLGRGAGRNAAGLGGAGGGLRFKPNRRVGIEADLDFLGGGTDYQGDKRSETSFSINGLLYLNPLSRAQVYLLAGFGWSGAHVTCDPSTMVCPNGNLDAQYSYFGGQLGAGLEIRLSRLFALNGDIRGFIRTRTDDKAQAQPEFVDASGRTTNTSGGALFTGGATLYF